VTVIVHFSKGGGGRMEALLFFGCEAVNIFSFSHKKNGIGEYFNGSGSIHRDATLLFQGNNYSIKCHSKFLPWFENITNGLAHDPRARSNFSLRVY
jgi:hypothetical protein